MAKAQMDAARRGGVSWGIAEEEALEEDLDNVTEGSVASVVLCTSLFIDLNFTGSTRPHLWSCAAHAATVCLSVRPSVCMSVRLSVCLSVCLFVCLLSQGVHLAA